MFHFLFVITLTYFVLDKIIAIIFGICSTLFWLFVLIMHSHTVLMIHLFTVCSHGSWSKNSRTRWSCPSLYWRRPWWWITRRNLIELKYIIWKDSNIMSHKNVCCWQQTFFSVLSSIPGCLWMNDRFGHLDSLSHQNIKKDLKNLFDN